jgi:hypothetical protein
MNKFQRWYLGGLWIQHKDDGWVRGVWRNADKEFIKDEHKHHYHKTLISIIKIEDYTGRGVFITKWIPEIMSRLSWMILGFMVFDMIRQLCK